jgi:pimeloyl-ACP methyl ester carboxylesterase
MSGTARQQQVNIGIDLNVWEWPGAAPAFVFLHGLASNARTWSQVAEYLTAHGHRVVAYDQRGHGLSGNPGSGFGFAECQEDLARLIDALHLERPIVAGQSWGGNVVLEFAAAHPGVSRGLAFVDGGFLDLRARSGATWESTACELRPPELVNLSLAEIAARIRAEHPGWSARGVEDTLANLEQLADGTVRRRLPVEHHMAIVHALWEHDPRALFPQVREPVLICAAEPAGPQAREQRHGEVQAAVTALAASRVEWFTSSDHDIHVHRPLELSVVLMRELVRGLWSNTA